MTIITAVLVLATDIPVSVPDAGSSGLLLGLGALSLGAVAHFLRKRKK